MQHYKCAESRSQVQVYKNPWELANAAASVARRSVLDFSIRSGVMNVDGIPLSDYASILEAVKRPWQEGIRKVKAFTESLEGVSFPELRDRRRKMRRREDRGELDIDRAIHGEDNIYDNAEREETTAPPVVCVICNVDASGFTSGDSMFWRGAGAIALVDLLETHGYSCEMWLWEGGLLSYASRESPFPHSLVTCKIKEAGEPVNMGSLAVALSPWYLRTCVFGTRGVLDRNYRSLGMVTPRLQAPWLNYFDTSEGVIKVCIPFMESRRTCVEKIREIIPNIQNGHGPELFDDGDFSIGDYIGNFDFHEDVLSDEEWEERERRIAAGEEVSELLNAPWDESHYPTDDDDGDGGEQERFERGEEI